MSKKDPEISLGSPLGLAIFQLVLTQLFFESARGEPQAKDLTIGSQPDRLPGGNNRRQDRVQNWNRNRSFHK